MASTKINWILLLTKRRPEDLELYRKIIMIRGYMSVCCNLYLLCFRPSMRTPLTSMPWQTICTETWWLTWRTSVSSSGEGPLVGRKNIGLNHSNCHLLQLFFSTSLNIYNLVYNFKQKAEYKRDSYRCMHGLSFKKN